jgi:hypothetical protein
VRESAESPHSVRVADCMANQSRLSNSSWSLQQRTRLQTVRRRSRQKGQSGGRLIRSARSFRPSIFLVIGEQSHRAWIDVKTVAPQWQDDDEAWQRFLDIAAEFPSNARLGVRRDFCGAAISGQAIKARWTSIRRTIEVEQKAALISPAEKGRVWLLFCSDSGAWHPDELEDFADFYRTGKFRDEDWSRNAIARYMKEEKLAFARTLEEFHYLRRRQDELNVELRLAMRGPRLFGP